MDEKVIIQKIVPGGQGIGTLSDGRKIFLWNALPDEIVTSFEVTKKKSHYLEGIATSFDSQSFHRVMPKDKCYLATSPWQMMDYAYELALKSELVVEVFRQNGITIDYPEVITDEKDYFYRNKMEYALYYDLEEQKIKLAFHMRGSHRKVPISNSSIERPEILTRARKVVDELNNNGEEARKYQSLLLRCDQDGKVHGGLFENGKPHPNFEKLDDVILGNKYSYSPNGFFQINLPVYEKALSEIRKWVSTDEVLDLYAGVGTIGLSVARDKKLILVESNKAAYLEMEKNCLGTVAKPILAKSEEVLEYIQPEQTVILDPPRAGCDQKLIQKLIEVRPKKVVYLSCNPATQARDVKMLFEKYRIETMKTFNFFPRTPHIENLVVLNLK